MFDYASCGIILYSVEDYKKVKEIKRKKFNHGFEGKAGHSLLDSYTGGYLDKSYYNYDSLGSIIGTFNDKGSLDESYSYDSF